MYGSDSQTIQKNIIITNRVTIAFCIYFRKIKKNMRYYTHSSINFNAFSKFSGVTIKKYFFSFLLGLFGNLEIRRLYNSHKKSWKNPKYFNNKTEYTGHVNLNYFELHFSKATASAELGKVLAFSQNFLISCLQR